MTTRLLRAVAPLVAVTFLLAACGRDDPGPPRVVGDDPRILVSDSGGSEQTVGVAGTVEYDPQDRCIYVMVGDVRHTAVWPHGTRPVVEDGKRGVRVPDVGVILEGQTFDAGGDLSGVAARETPFADDDCVVPGGFVLGIASVNVIGE